METVCMEKETVQKGKEKDLHVKIREKYNVNLDSSTRQSPRQNVGTSAGTKQSVESKIQTFENKLRPHYSYKQAIQKPDLSNKEKIKSSNDTDKDGDKTQITKSKQLETRFGRVIENPIQAHSLTNTNTVLIGKKKDAEQSSKEKEKSADEGISSDQESEKIQTSRLIRYILDPSVRKVIESPIQKQENLTTSSKELQTRNEDIGRTTKVIHTNYQTRRTHVIQLAEPEKIKETDMPLRTYQDYIDAAKRVSTAPKAKGLPSNEADLKSQGVICKELEIQYENEEKKEANKKKKSTGNSVFCCCECLVQCFECL